MKYFGGLNILYACTLEYYYGGLSIGDFMQKSSIAKVLFLATILGIVKLL